MRNGTVRRARRGFAILMVVMIALILSSFATIIWYLGSGDKAIKEVVQEKKQSEYVARGAQQHFLLKFRYMPTELYDAVAYSIGKNPYYDFGRPHAAIAGNVLDAGDALVNPGPMFFFGSNVTNSAPAGTAPKISRDVNLQSPGPSGVNKDNIQTLLRLYLLDVATMYPDDSDENKGIVVISSKDHQDKGMTQPASSDPQPWRDPFVGNYAVQNASILGLSGGKRYDKDSLLVVTLGSVRRAGQISLVTKGNVNGLRNLSTGRMQISKLGRDTQSFDFPEARTYLEDLTEYQKKMKDDATKSNRELVFGVNDDPDQISSGRRTEIATGVYQIQRQKQ